MDLSELRERRSRDSFSVTELNNYIKGLIESDRILSAVTVKGEISNFTNHSSGHMYFSLKDADSQIKCVMFRSSVSRLKFIPEFGMKVIICGNVSLYQRDGTYQIYVTSMQPDGIGALYLAYEQLKNKLSDEGLFDEYHKKTLPCYPTKIGVVTSPTGAAIRDICNVLGRRYPLAKIYIYPSLVQGADAERDLVNGIDYFDRSGAVDLVIIGRGGGSIEDLWAFNSENLARRIFEATVPIISAVGHETDFTICDFVSDMRAPTPSAAAELAVPDIRDLLHSVAICEERCEAALNKSVKLARGRLSNCMSAFSYGRFKLMMNDNHNLVNDLLKTSENQLNLRINDAKHRLAIGSEKLVSLNPLSVLMRGYAVAEVNGNIINDSNNVIVGDVVTLRLASGGLRAEIVEIIDK